MINFYPLSHKISSFFLLKISSLLLLISFPFRYKHHIMIVIKCNRLMTELELSCPIELAFSNANFQLPYLYKISHRANWCLSHWVTTLSICFFFLFNDIQWRPHYASVAFATLSSTMLLPRRQSLSFL